MVKRRVRYSTLEPAHGAEHVASKRSASNTKEDNMQEERRHVEEIYRFFARLEYMRRKLVLKTKRHVTSFRGPVSISYQ